MIKKIALGLSGFVLLSLPVITVAQTSAPMCPAITHTLYLGSRDSTTSGDVSTLQAFLMQQYPSGISGYTGEGLSVSGYFGRITQKYVIQFQKDHGLAPIGIVGPLTRAAITAACGNSGGGSASFNATPTRGAAPLAVVFTSNTQGNINFGDGVSDVMQANCTISFDGVSHCDNTHFFAHHTYTSTGSYTATLTGMCSGTACTSVFLGSATITVGSTNVTAPVISSISPTSGPTGTSVTITGSGFSSTDNTIHFGVGGTAHVASNDGTTLTYTIPTGVSPCDLVTQPPTCAAVEILVNHGVYQITVTNSSGATSNQMPFTVTDSNPPVCEHAAPPQGCYWQAGASCDQDQLICPNNQSFTATPTSGNAPLNVAFTYSANGAGYAIYFGDGTNATMAFNDAVNTASHTYATGGTYTASVAPACALTGCPYAHIYPSVTITVNGPSTSPAPTITSLTPNSGSTGTTVTITGSGFSATGNTIHFGIGGASGVASPDGTTLQYLIPANLSPCDVTQPQFYCAEVLQLVNPGVYQITVNNSSGASSNQMPFTVTGGQTAPANFTATPSSGAAPLAVGFKSNMNGKIDFGDGTSGYMGFNDAWYSATHTYSNAGTYTANLMSQCTGTGCTPVLLGSVTITVSSSGVSTGLTATPNSGTAPLTVSLTSDLGTSIDFGDGTPVQTFAYCNNTSCQTQGFTTSHTYAAGGTYVAKAMTGSQIMSSATVTVSGSTPPPTNFSATPTSGAAPLAVTFTSNQAGSVDHGDGSLGGALVLKNSVYSTTYTYTAPGTYTAKIYGLCQYVCQPPLLATFTITVAGSGGAQQYTLSAMPTGGFSPYIMQFTTNQIPVGTYRIQFGDGSSGPAQKLQCSGTTCTYWADHAFSGPGTHTAQLLGNCVSTSCSSVLASVVFTVGTVAATPDQSAQLANAYTALISVLQQLIAIWH